MILPLKLSRSPTPPTMAVLPSAESATDVPCCEPELAPDPTSFGPCCLQTPSTRVQTQAAPSYVLSRGAPMMAVLPSAERATKNPCRAVPTFPKTDPDPISLACWLQIPALLVHIQAAP